MSSKPTVPSRPAAKAQPAVPARPNVAPKPNVPAKPKPALPPVSTKPKVMKQPSGGRGAPSGSQRGAPVVSPRRGAPGPVVSPRRGAVSPRRAAPVVSPRRTRGGGGAVSPQRLAKPAMSLQSKSAPNNVAAGSRTPVARTKANLPKLNPVPVKLEHETDALVRAPLGSLPPPKEKTTAPKSDVPAVAAAGSQTVVVKVARVKKARSAEPNRRVQPSKVPMAMPTSNVPAARALPRGVGAVTESEISLLLHTEDNAKVSKKLKLRKAEQSSQVEMTPQEEEELIARSMNEVVVKTAWERPIEANPLAMKMAKELERLDREKASAEDKEKWMEIENQRLLQWRQLLEETAVQDAERIRTLSSHLAVAQKERDEAYACCQAVEDQCRAVMGLLLQSNTMLSQGGN